jgi:tRNA(fMet)-specific endonuclease VapC
MRRLLDTNAYVALKRGEASIADLVRSSEKLFVSIIVLGELHFGFHDGRRRRENLAELDEFLAHPFVDVAYLTVASADRFGRVATALKRAGTPIPTNDIWIAAQCLELGAELITLDHRHFQQVAGLVVAGAAE